MSSLNPTVLANPAVSVVARRKRRMPSTLSWNHHGGAESQDGVVPGQRRQLTAVGGLVEGEQHEREVGLVAESSEERRERVYVIGAGRDVGADVGTEAFEHRRVVVPMAARVELDDQPVVQAHPHHLGEHLATEGLGLVAGVVARADPVEQAGGIGRVEIAGSGAGVAVIGRGGAVRDEELPALGQGRQVAGPGGGVLPGQLAQPLQVRDEVGTVRVDHRVGPERRDHPAVPVRVGDGSVVGQVVERRFGRGQELDPEPVEERPGPEVGLVQSGGHVVVDLVGGRGVETHADPEHLAQGVVHPDP